VIFIIKVREQTMENFKKTNSKNLFCESRLIYKRREKGLNSNHTPTEPGLGQVEDMLDAFQQKYDPENLNYAEHNVNEIIHGVRKNMMQGPFNDLNVLSGGNILDKRVRSKLSDIAEKVPEKYQHIIDEEVRRTNRHLETKEIARELFTYENIAGANYLTFVRNLENELHRFGPLGAATFRDSRGNQINLANPNASNEFDVSVGPAGNRETVTINWHTENFASIQEKLKRAGMWAYFSRQGSVREFIHMHFRLSLVKQAIAEEKAKLSVDRFSPQMLKIWLDNELTTRALDGLGATPSATDIKAARGRIHEASIAGRLEKILLPNTLEDMSDSMETRTMLAYLRHKLDDPNDSEEIDSLLDELSGAVDTNKITNLQNEIANIENQITTENNQISDFDNIPILKTTTFAETDQLSEEIQKLNTEIGITRGKKQDALVAKKDNKEKELNRRQMQLVEQFKALQWQLNALTNPTTQSQNIVDFISPNITTYTTSNIATYLDSIRNLLANPSLRNEINDIINTEKQEHKAKLDTLNQDKLKKQAELDAEKSKTKPENQNIRKIDSRGLLYKLVEHDLKKKGVSVEAELEKQAIIGTNSLINICRNGEVYGDVNKAIAEELNSNPDWTNRTERWFHKLPFFSSKLSGQDAIEHLIDIDPELKMFKEIQITSTKADLLKMMHKYGKDCSPTKLRELSGKIGEIIRGFNVGEKNKKVDVKDIPRLERLIHVLGLLEAQLTTERFITEVRDQAEVNPANRGDIILDLLQEQTEASQRIDTRIKNLIEEHEAEFKKLYTRKELAKRFNEAMDLLGPKPTPEEITEIFDEYNIDPRAVSRGVVSIKTARKLRSLGKGILKYNPVTLIAVGIGKSVSYIGKKVWTRFDETIIQPSEASRKGLAEMRKGAIFQPIIQPIGWVWGAMHYIGSRPKVWVQKVTDKVDIASPKK